MKSIVAILLFTLVGCGLGSGEDGWHRGHLTDISRAGWFCRAPEGQIMSGSGSASLHYEFTITSDEVFEQLRKAQKSGREVNLHYSSPRIYSLCSSSHSTFVDAMEEIAQ